MITAMDAELLEHARAVDPTVLGRRVREARLARQLTQTAVAGKEMSTAYVSRIEAGQRRPDPDLIAVIAERVGVPLDQLVMGTSRDVVAELRTRLMSAEMSLKTGSASDALAILDDLLDELPAASPDQREARFLRGLALEATGNLDDAIIALEDASADVVHDTSWLDCLTALSRCYRESGSFPRAIEVGEKGLSIVGEAGLAGSFSATRLSLAVAASYFESGDTGQAVRLCRRAIDAAEKIDSTEAMAMAYWNASVIESRLGRPSSALALGAKALLLVEIGDDYRQRALMRTQLGVYELRSSTPDAESALAQLQRAEADLVTSDCSPADLAFNKLNQARANLLMGRLDAARADLAATSSVSEHEAPLVVAEGHVLNGQIAFSEGDAANAQEFYRRAVWSLTAAGADRGAAQLWFELGSLLEQVGELRGALDAYKRAGASTGLRDTSPLTVHAASA